MDIGQWTYHFLGQWTFIFSSSHILTIVATIYVSLVSLLRRGLHEVSSERKVSAQGVMGRAK